MIIQIKSIEDLFTVIKFDFMMYKPFSGPCPYQGFLCQQETIFSCSRFKFKIKYIKTVDDEQTCYCCFGNKKKYCP